MFDGFGHGKNWKNFKIDLAQRLFWQKYKWFSCGGGGGSPSGSGTFLMGGIMGRFKNIGVVFGRNVSVVGGGGKLSVTHTFCIGGIIVKFHHIGVDLRWKLNLIQKLYAYLFTHNYWSYDFSLLEWRLQLCWTTLTPPSGWQVWVNLRPQNVCT